MRRSIGTAAATLTVVAAIAASATPAGAVLPYIEQDSLYRQTGAVNIALGDGSVRFISNSTPSIETYRALGTRNGGEVISDY